MSTKFNAQIEIPHKHFYTYVLNQKTKKKDSNTKAYELRITMIGRCRKHHKCNTKIGKERYLVRFRDNFIKSFETTTHTKKQHTSS